jgi:hypothetical protein
LQVFDQIIDINAMKVTPELTGELLQRAVKQVQSKVSAEQTFDEDSVDSSSFFSLFNFAGENDNLSS